MTSNQIFHNNCTKYWILFKITPWIIDNKILGFTFHLFWHLPCMCLICYCWQADQPHCVSSPWTSLLSNLEMNLLLSSMTKFRKLDKLSVPPDQASALYCIHLKPIKLALWHNLIPSTIKPWKKLSQIWNPPPVALIFSLQAFSKVFSKTAFFKNCKASNLLQIFNTSVLSGHRPWKLQLLSHY